MRYLLFAGNEYDNDGGWHEFVGAFATKGDAIGAGVTTKKNWFHVVGTEQLEVVYEWSKGLEFGIKWDAEHLIEIDGA